MLITEQPPELKPENDLDNIDADELGPVPAQLKLAGKTLLVMDIPPVKGEFVKVELTLKCKGDGSDLLEGDELVYFRKCVLVAAKVTTQPYKPQPEPKPEPEAGLLNADGTTNPDARPGDPDDVDDLDTEDEDEDEDGEE